MLLLPLHLHKAHCYLEKRRDDCLAPELGNAVLQIQPRVWNQIGQPEHIPGHAGMSGSRYSALVKVTHLQPQTEML